MTSDITELSPLFQYPRIALETFFGDRKYNVSDSRFEGLLQSRQAFCGNLSEIYWGAFGSEKRCNELLDAGFFELSEEVEDRWFFRLMMATTSNSTRRPLISSNELDRFIQRTEAFLRLYLSAIAPGPLDTPYSGTLNYCLIACMNLLYSEADVKLFRNIVMAALLIMERERVWSDGLKSSLWFGVLTNYMCQLIRRQCHSEIENILDDAIGVGIAGLRYSCESNNPQRPSNVPFAPQDFSASLALLRNALAVETPPILLSALRNEAVLEKYRISNGPTMMIQCFNIVLRSTPDRHVVHCLCNIVHYTEWSNPVLRLAIDNDSLVGCFNSLSRIANHDVLAESLKRVARMCLWRAHQLRLSVDDIEYWYSALIAWPKKRVNSLKLVPGSRFRVDWLRENELTVLKTVMYESEMEDVILIRLRLKEMVKILEFGSVDDEAYSPLLRSKDEEVDSFKPPDDYTRSFIFAREHVILMSEVTKIPSFSVEWEHYVFRPPLGSMASLECDRLKYVKLNQIILVDLRIFVLGIYPLPHWPNSQPEMPTSSPLSPQGPLSPHGVGYLLNEWNAVHPFDAFLYIRDGNYMLLCNHFGREIHLFMKFSRDYKKTV